MELNPRDPSSFTELGNAYGSLRRWSEAERMYTRALALDPNNINAAFHLSVTYINGPGDIRRAREAQEAAPEQPKGQVSPYGVVISQMINEKVYLDVLERHFADALKAWDVLPTFRERVNASNVPHRPMEFTAIMIDAKAVFPQACGAQLSAATSNENKSALHSSQISRRHFEPRRFFVQRVCSFRATDPVAGTRDRIGQHGICRSSGTSAKHDSMCCPAL